MRLLEACLLPFLQSELWVMKRTGRRSNYNSEVVQVVQSTPKQTYINPQPPSDSVRVLLSNSKVCICGSLPGGWNRSQPHLRGSSTPGPRNVNGLTGCTPGRLPQSFYRKVTPQVTDQVPMLRLIPAPLWLHTQKLIRDT